MPGTRTKTKNIFLTINHNITQGLVEQGQVWGADIDPLQKMTLQDEVRTGGVREIPCDGAEEAWCVSENPTSKNLRDMRGSNMTAGAATRESSFAVSLPEGTMPHTAAKSSRPFLAFPPLPCPSPPPWSSPAPPEGGQQVERELSIFLCPRSFSRLTGWKRHFQWNRACSFDILQG